MNQQEARSEAIERAKRDYCRFAVVWIDDDGEYHSHTHSEKKYLFPYNYFEGRTVETCDMYSEPLTWEPYGRNDHIDSRDRDDPRLNILLDLLLGADDDNDNPAG